MERSWSTDQVETFKQMWMDGRSHEEIGEVIKRSPGSVCAKARYLNFPRRKGPTPWTEDLVEQLRHYWIAGLPVSQIGVALGFPRGAVIGKIHRLGFHLKYPRQASRSVYKPKPRHRPQKIQYAKPATRAERMTVARERPPAELYIPPRPKGFRGLSLMDLEGYHCRYVLGGDDVPFSYCGQPVVYKSWCAQCVQIVLEPAHA